MLPIEYARQKQDFTLYNSDITEKIIGAAIEVHRNLGPGLLESVYEQCLCHEFDIRGIHFRRQCELNVEYKGLTIECAYRPDLIVEDEVIVELKAADQNSKVFEAQLLTYLKLGKKKVGLLINFGLPNLRQGLIRRVV